MIIIDDSNVCGNCGGYFDNKGVCCNCGGYFDNKGVCCNCGFFISNTSNRKIDELLFQGLIRQSGEEGI